MGLNFKVGHVDFTNHLYRGMCLHMADDARYFLVWFSICPLYRRDSVNSPITWPKWSYLAMVKYQKIWSCDFDLWPMTLKFNRVFAVVWRCVFVQNFIELSNNNNRKTSYLFQRISVLVQRFNAVLLHDSLPAADCTDWRSYPPLYCVVNF